MFVCIGLLLIYKLLSSTKCHIFLTLPDNYSISYPLFAHFFQLSHSTFLAFFPDNFVYPDDSRHHSTDPLLKQQN